ncbi:MAG: hypothetical protein M3P24_09905 [Gemmatimonadota bacterium]|nr:hypothetical protein [Gemmatimonadota bacterium]
MNKRYAYLAAAALAMGASPAAAQTSVSMTVPQVLTLAVTGSVTLANANDAAFTAGFQQSSTDLSISHKGNVRHRVQVAGPAGLTNLGFAALSGRSETDPGKPLSDVRLSTDNFTTPVNLGTSASPATLIEQSSATGSGSATVKTRLMLGNYATIPGTYSTTMTFTIVEY